MRYALYLKHSAFNHRVLSGGVSGALHCVNINSFIDLLGGCSSGAGHTVHQPACDRLAPRATVSKKKKKSVFSRGCFSSGRRGRVEEKWRWRRGVGGE